MKLLQHTNTLETNMPAKTKKFTSKNLAKLIGLLRNNIYTYKIGTPVQEYMSNARDSMRQAKSTKRMIVTVPNQMNPVFKVRDFGTGVTPHAMDTVFIDYGSSTKEDSNDMAGGFGIGSKSAWAYTDSFTVTSITDGVKRVYVMHTGTNNEGSYNLISEEETTEETGVEVQIVVKPGDINEFRNAIWRACHFWRKEEYPEFKGVVAHEVPVRSTTLRVGDLELMQNLPPYIRLEHNSYRDYLSVVIDGIPHAASREFLKQIPEVMDLLKPMKGNVLIHVGNGVMDFPASREMISTEAINKEVLTQLAPKLKAEMEKYVESEFAKAKNYDEWIAVYNQVDRLYSISNKTKEGAAKHVRAEFAKAKTIIAWIACYQRIDKAFMPLEFAKRGGYLLGMGNYSNGLSISAEIFSKFEVLHAGPNRGRRSKGGFKREDAGSIEINSLPHLFYVDNHDEAMVTQNKRIKEYLLRNNGLRRVVLLCAKQQIEMVEPKTKKLVAAGPAKDMGKGVMATPLMNAPLVEKVVTTFDESEKALKKALADLGGLPLSILPFTPTPKKPRVPRAQRDRTKEEFTIHKMSYGHKRPRTKTLAKVQADNEKYLYIPYADCDKYYPEFKEMEDFVGNLGYELCALAPKSVRMVQGAKEFKLYDTWRKSFKVDAKTIAQALYNKSRNIKHMSILKKAATKVKDKTLQSMLETYEPVLKIDTTSELPKFVAEMVSKEVKEFEIKDAALTKLIKEKYPLLVRIGEDVVVDAVTSNELAIYINAKV